MGKPTPASNDFADMVAAAALTAPGQTTPAFAPLGYFNMELTGVFTGNFVIERSFDGGVSYVPVTQGGAAVSFTGPASEMLENRERGVLLRWRCVALASGSAQARLSQ